MDVEIIPTKYHKTTVGADGITHKVDTSEAHISYQVQITERYYVDDEDALLDSILRDLGRLTETFQELKRSRQPKEEQR